MLSNFFQKITKNIKLVSTLGMIIGSSLYCFSVVFVLDKGAFYAGGITGISQIIAFAFNLPILESILIAAFNIPLFLMGWKSVSKRFAYLSLFSIIYQVIIIYLKLLIIIRFLILIWQNRL